MSAIDAVRGVADAAALEHAAVLAATSSVGLLDALIRLTHTIHATASEATAAELRAQREVVKAEVLRRCEQ